MRINERFENFLETEDRRLPADDDLNGEADQGFVYEAHLRDFLAKILHLSRPV